VEGSRHELARLEVVAPPDFERREEELFREARRLMPKLPFADVDLLIVDEIGKNISGAGLDPNITGRWVHGYSTSLGPDNRPSPMIRRVFVREPTPETHGNVIGIGFADATTTRLLAAMDKQATYINAMTSMTLNSAKIPIHFDTDREAIERMLGTLGLPDLSQARVIHVRNTLELETVAVSTAYQNELAIREDLEVIRPAAGMSFDAKGNLSMVGRQDE
ncbi:MAG TPA: [Fe-S]-binding protein, partial [Verrucomicrobiae bacterium]|nr:[Fe-S]-binding protein [Verrucomicrobiae bacterium]